MRDALITGTVWGARGAFRLLHTVDGAALNVATFQNGYATEAFLRLLADVRATNGAWMSALCRMGTGKGAGRTSGDPAERAKRRPPPPRKRRHE